MKKNEYLGHKKGFKYRLLLQKRYFDAGFGFLNAAKYLVGFYGLSSLNVRSTMTFGLLYFLFCYLFGKYYINKGWFEMDQEITNDNNLFVKQMRKRFK